jgi:hypothetical protein
MRACLHMDEAKLRDDVLRALPTCYHLQGEGLRTVTARSLTGLIYSLSARPFWKVAINYCTHGFIIVSISALTRCPATHITCTLVSPCAMSKNEVLRKIDFLEV